MKNKLRNLLLSGMASLALSSCATTIHGYVDASYVPLRISERGYKNEIRTEVDTRAEMPLGDAKLIIGEDIVTYMNIVNPIPQKEGVINGGFFSPTFTDYISYLKWNIPLNNLMLQFYAFHNCFHPIGQSSIIEQALTKNPIDGSYDRNVIRSTGETRIGVKIEY